MKLNPQTIIAARQRYNEMKRDFDASPVLSFMVRSGYVASPAAAEQTFDALLQWLAGHAIEPHCDSAYVMFNGPVDDAFHGMLLNTRLYMDFCKRFVGFFIHHTPLDVAAADQFAVDGAIEYTVHFLQAVFGELLAEPLQGWVEDLANGKLTITAVSCIWKINVEADAGFQETFGINSQESFWRDSQVA